MNRHSFFMLVTGFILSLTLMSASAEETTELPAGRYMCATVTSESHLEVVEVTITRDGEIVTAMAQSKDTVLAGRLLGNRLFLVRQDITDLGLEIVQVVGAVHDDGAVRGIATRTLDGAVTERGAFTLRRLTQ